MGYGYIVFHHNLFPLDAGVVFSPISYVPTDALGQIVRLRLEERDDFAHVLAGFLNFDCGVFLVPLMGFSRFFTVTHKYTDGPETKVVLGLADFS